MDAEDRDAAFDAWLHEAGYTYFGPTSIYRLTIPEMARLNRGYRVLHEEEEGRMAESGHLDARTRAQLKNPARTPPGQVRPGDKKALEEFNQRRMN